MDGMSIRCPSSLHCLVVFSGTNGQVRTLELGKQHRPVFSGHACPPSQGGDTGSNPVGTATLMPGSGGFTHSPLCRRYELRPYFVRLRSGLPLPVSPSWPAHRRVPTVPVLGGLLVANRGHGARMISTSHELGGTGSGSRRPRQARVPEIVESDILATRHLASVRPRMVERSLVRWHSIGSSEQPRVALGPDVSAQMMLKDRGDVRWFRDTSCAGVCLRRPNSRA
jgi:hypothetical protein